MAAPPHRRFCYTPQSPERQPARSLACTGSDEPDPWRGFSPRGVGPRSPSPTTNDSDEECDRVRIMIAGPPKAGNVWLKCILGHIYDLRPLLKHETPQRPQFHLLKAWLEDGNFPDGTIFHQHYDYKDELADLDRCGARAHGHHHPRSVRRVRLLLFHHPAAQGRWPPQRPAHRRHGRQAA